MACCAAVDILSDILTYERLDSNLLTIERRECDIVPLLETVVKMFQIQAIHSSVTLTFEHQSFSSSSLVNGDATKLTQVFRNLISNGLKFTPAGGSVIVRLTANDADTSEGGSLQVSVQDTGPGMSRADRRRLFHEIVQFNPVGLQKGQGSGLGLYISRRIVDMHDGSISVDMDRDDTTSGSIFYVSLPRLQPGGASLLLLPGRPIAQPLLISEIPIPARKLRLLIVDDDALCRKITYQLLGRFCEGREEAANGIEAIEKVKASMAFGIPFDAILMDNMMPLMNGPEASKCIRSLGFKGKIIGVTGGAFDEDVEGFLQEGANEVLIKPLRIKDYAHAIDVITEGIVEN